MTQPTRGGGDDIVFGAEIDDQTIAFFNRFDKNIDRLAQKGEEGFNRVENAIEDVGPRIGIVSGLVSGLTTKLIEFGIQGLNAIKQFVEGSIQLTARVDVLATVLNQVAATAGYTAEETARAEEEVKSMGITTQAARQSLIQMARANVSWAEATNLARLAQDAAVVAGINSSQAFERLILGIQRREIELLRTMGIMVDQQAAQRRLAAELGKTANNLTEAEKSQAFLNAVMEQGETIAGSYAGAMENAGKQATSLPRYFEELQLAIGRAFQPAFAAKIQFMTEELKEMKEWFDENEDAIAGFAEAFGNFTTLLLGYLSNIIDLAKALPGLIVEAGEASAKAIGIIVGKTEEELERLEEQQVSTWERFGQLLVLIMYVWGTFGGAVVGVLEIIGDGLSALAGQAMASFQLLQATIEGDVEGMANAIEALFSEENSIEAWVNRSKDALAGLPRAAEAQGLRTAQGFINTFGAAFGIVIDKSDEMADEVIDDLEDIGDELDNITDKARQFGEAIFAAGQKMKAANMEAFLEVQREQIQELIRLSHQIEDIERANLERINQIRADYERDHAAMLERQEEERVDLAAEHADKRLKLEEDRAEEHIRIEQRFQDRLQDIQDNFEFDAREAGRQRDAVRLRQLMRQRDKEIKEAEKARDRARRDTDRDYNKRLEELDDWLEEEQDRLAEAHAEEQQELEDHLEAQLKQAEEAHRKAYEDLQRSLQREQQLRDAARAFENAERARQFIRELNEHGLHLGMIEDITDMSLDNMLDLWDLYFEDLGDMIDDYITFLEDQRERINDAGGGRSGGGRQREEGRGGRPNRGQSNVIGQGGQVSDILTNIGNRQIVTNNNFFTQGVPAVPPSSSVDRREILVKVDAPGMDPHIQRVLVNTLTEIERNRVSTKGITRR